MARNIALRVLRGLKANIPALNVGEMYLATDEVQLYIGTSTGNQLILGNTLGVGNSGTKSVIAPQKGTGGGPLAPLNVVTFAKYIIGGQTYWVPLMQ